MSRRAARATRSTPGSSACSTPPAGSPSSSRSTPRSRRRRPSNAASGARPRLRPVDGRRFASVGRDAMSEDRLKSLLDEYAELEARLADPAIHADQNQARKVGRRFAELTPIAKSAAELTAAKADLTAARELVAEDPAFGAEAAELEAKLPVLEERLAELLAPRGPDDGKDVILEIKAGEGGEESALFAGDLLRMYLRYAERHGWVTEVLDSHESALGGDKDVAVAVKTRGGPEGGDGGWSRLKWEGGGPPGPRVPATQSPGRIPTPAPGGLV